MRVALISNQAKSMLNFRGPLISELNRLGHEVLALAPDFDPQTRTECLALGARPLDFTMSRSGMNPVKELLAIFRLRNLLRSLRPDITLSFFLKPVIYGTIAAWSAGIKRRFALIEGLGFAFTSTSNFELRRLVVQRLFVFVARFAMRRLDKVLFLNADDELEMINRGMVNAERTRLLGPIGVNLEEWPAKPLPKGRATFILVARLLYDKGIRDYVEAARILRRDHPEARFLLIGGLDENPAAIAPAEVQSWVDAGLIEWPGHVEVLPWLSKANVFVLPSYREGFPRSTQEAMALGRPVVTTDVPGCRDTVVEGRNGYKVPARNPSALAKAMQQFIENPQIIATMGAESRKMAEEQFDVRSQNKKLLGYMNIRCGE